MSGLILCGKRSTRPYYIAMSDINIYSIEELQYYVYNNLYLISRDFFNEDLTSYIKEELELPVVAQKIKYMMSQKADYRDIILLLLSSGSYYSSMEIKQAEQDMKDIGNLSLAQRMKTKADSLYKVGKLSSALKAYAGLLSKTTKSDNSDEFYASIWNNMGAAYAKLFLYEEAYTCYKMAADLRPATEIMDRLVIAALMCEDDSILSDVTAQYGVTPDEIEQYKNALNYEKKHITTNPDVNREVNRLVYNANKEINAYYKEIISIVNEWKEKYREEVS